MPITGSTTLPVAPRDTPWDGQAARTRILDACSTAACIGRAFLWRDPDGDPATIGAYSLGYCDMVDGRLTIIPRGVAAAAGGRGVNAANIPENAKTAVRRKICGLYTRIQSAIEDWPDCPLTEAAAVTAAARSNGSRFEGPVAFEGVTTGDGRRFKRGALRWTLTDEQKIPFVFNREEMGHTGAVIGGVTSLRRDGNAIIATGTLDVDTEDPVTKDVVQRARELLVNGSVGVSIIFDDDTLEDEDADVLVWTDARIRQVALVDVPAFDQARVALVAAADVSWFSDPKFGDEHDLRLVVQVPERPEETRSLGAPFTVEPDGRVFGHFALWNRCHVGSPGTCVTPPREPASFRGFLTGSRFPGVATGPIVMRTSHAPLAADLDTAQHHYAHTGMAVADVTVGSDNYGLWAAGALRAGLDEATRDELRGSALSGDWRVIGGKHRLIGILAVNAPGFRVARALAAAGSLITNGPGCDLCDEHPSLEERVAELERRLAQFA